MYRLTKRRIYTIISGLLCGVAAMLWVTAMPAMAGSPNKAGTLESYKLVGSYTSQEIEHLLATEPGLDNPSNGSGRMNIQEQETKPVKMYRVIYRTPDPKGKLVRASGLVMVPDPPGLKPPYPLVSFQHGTIKERNHAPSSPRKCVYTPWMTMFAGYGYVISMPDYIGMGISEIRHPYAHAETEASSSRDMLRAAKTLCSRLGVQLNGKLFLSGYSQGGRATMALQRLLENEHADEFEITASAPGGGPYDHFLFWTSGLKNPNKTSTVVAAYMLVAYNRIYGLWKEAGEVFKDPYYKYVDSLFDGKHSEPYIEKKLPNSLPELLHTEFIEQFNQGLNSTYVAFVANSTNTWRPEAPTRLFHASGDEACSFQQAVLTARFMKSLGANVRVVDVGDYQHVEAFPYALQATKDWFDTF